MEFRVLRLEAQDAQNVKHGEASISKFNWRLSI